MISIIGLDKGAVLAALHNAAKPQGMGFLHARGDMIAAEVWAEYNATTEDRKRFFWEPDYFHGRPIKCNLTGDEFDPRLFDRDAGAGSAARAIDEIRAV